MADSANIDFLAGIDWYCDYFAAWNEYRDELVVATRIRDALQSEGLQQAQYDRLLPDLGRCSEGSVLCAMWREFRAWGREHGLVVPNTEFPWR